VVMYQHHQRLLMVIPLLLVYSGVSYDVLTMVSLGGGSYSGTIFTSLLETQTTGSLGYLGRTIC
jgi:hypothetical protein